MLTACTSDSGVVTTAPAASIDCVVTVDADPLVMTPLPKFEPLLMAFAAAVKRCASACAVTGATDSGAPLPPIVLPCTAASDVSWDGYCALASKGKGGGKSPGLGAGISSHGLPLSEAAAVQISPEIPRGHRERRRRLGSCRRCRPRARTWRA